MEKWKKIIRYAQPLLIIILGIILFFWSRLSPILSLEIKTFLGITLALFGTIIFYFDNILNKILNMPKIFENANLGDCIKNGYQYVNDIRKIRIFALSTYMIQSIFKDLKIKTLKCSIIVYDNDSLNQIPINQWIHYKNDGYINDIDIYKYSYYPTEYYVIFDNKALVYGHYLIKDDRFPNCDVQEAFFINDLLDQGKHLIEKYIEVFDALEQSNLVKKIVFHN